MGDRSETGRQRCRKMYPVLGQCEHAGGCADQATDRHHVDGDTFNNARSNIEFLCRRHHMAIDGRTAALAAVPRPIGPPKPCSNCSQPAKPLRRGRCGACSEYLRRTGIERPWPPPPRGGIEPRGRSGVRGVGWDNRRQKWVARKGGKQLGRFDTIAAAAAALGNA